MNEDKLKFRLTELENKVTQIISILQIIKENQKTILDIMKNDSP